MIRSLRCFKFSLNCASCLPFKPMNSFPKLKAHLDGKHKQDLQFTCIKQYKLDRKNWDTVTHSSYRANELIK